MQLQPGIQHALQYVKRAAEIVCECSSVSPSRDSRCDQSQAECKGLLWAIQDLWNGASGFASLTFDISGGEKI